mmetsp:Transcript_49153/g.106906  ORF Transcript_49153/g.106906 Transcript_49153/m.106906 type:complete len:85 (-) Transcript_49153:96-350(-)
MTLPTSMSCGHQELPEKSMRDSSRTPREPRILYLSLLLDFPKPLSNNVYWIKAIPGFELDESVLSGRGPQGSDQFILPCDRAMR